jgi:vacuolar-type H+-ATPase subunit E/Vma4
VGDLEEALESVQQVLEQRVEKLEDLLQILQEVLDQFFELISELVESIEENPLSIKVNFSDLADVFRVLQQGVLKLIQTILDDIEGMQTDVIRIT